MACSGPSKEFAVIKAEAAFDEIMQMIRDKYYVERPLALGNAKGFEARMQADWDQHERELKEALVELFWTSDAASF